MRNVYNTQAHRLSHEYKNISPIFNDLERLFFFVSRPEANNQCKLIKPLDEIDESFSGLCDIFAQYLYYFAKPKFVHKEYQPLPVVDNTDKNIILCFSGGKDSVAAAMMYKALGYNVYLYHLHGINRSYYDEFKSVPKLAEMLECEYAIENVQLYGWHQFVEHPMKNIMIANAAIHWGIRNNIGTNIAFGNFTESYLEDNIFEVCAGDCIEMWNAYEQVIQRVIPDFKIHLILPKNDETFYQISKRPELLPHTNSCIGAYRYRRKLSAHNKEKYGIDILENRCGSCWKCAMEYIFFADHNVFEYNKEYYRHCLQILSWAVHKETGKWPKSMDELWHKYFFYDMHKSKEESIFYAAIYARYTQYPDGFIT